MRKSILFTLVAVVIAMSACTNTDKETPGLTGGFVRTQGDKLVVGDAQNEVCLRGVAIFTSDQPYPNERVYEDLANLNINTVRLAFSYRDFYNDYAPDMYKADAWDWIDAHIALARKHGMWLVLQNCGVEGAQFVPIKGIPFDYSIWDDILLQDRFVDLWRAIAGRYHDETQIVGYSLFYEPVTSESKTQWQNLAQRTIDEIRQVDPNHIVFVERIYGENEVRREVSGVDFAPDDAFFAVSDDNVVYEFYFFERDEYTHQFAPWRTDVQQARIYPDENWIKNHLCTSCATTVETDISFRYTPEKLLIVANRCAKDLAKGAIK